MKLLLPRLKALGYGTSMTAYYGLQGHMLEMNGIRIFPCAYHPYGMDVAAGNTKISGSIVCMTNVDVWVVEPAMLKDVFWVPWFPIDSETISPMIKAKLPPAFERYVMSKHGADMVQAAGFPCKFIPCSIDTNVFKPVNRIAARKEVNEHIQYKIPDNAYLVAMVAMNKGNPSRKAFCEQFRAFKAFQTNHPEAVLYAHTITSEGGQLGGVNLVEYCKHIGLQPNKDVIFPDPLTVVNGYPDVFLNAVYNSADVFMSVTMGEGFGVPILEAQAAGCPVITGDWTAMTEITFSGWKVRKEEAAEFWTVLGAIQYLPRWEAIADRLEQAYQMQGNQDYRDRATDGAQKYDIDRNIEKYWIPALDGLTQHIKDLPQWTEPIKPAEQAK
jgi:glycosyltransferase involved in cell wall biosynthesis